MISHRFISGKSKTGYPQQTLQVIVNNIEKDTLVAVINYLVENVHLIYNKNKRIDGDVMWPIEIKLNDCFILNESTFWKHVYHNIENAYQYLDKYIQTLYELSNTTEFNMLLMSNEYQYHGGLALNQYWLWSIEGTDSSLEELTVVFRAFNLWLSKNDLEFEVSQDDLINLILTRYGSLCDIETATLLALRLNDGQITDKNFDYLKSALINRSKNKNLLKQVIKQLFNSEIHLNGPNENEATILELCAVIYGSNEQCTQKVLEFARNESSKELWPVQEFQMKKINYLRQVGDIYWQQVTSQERYIDTSFHLFDTHTRKWIDYDEQE